MLLTAAVPLAGGCLLCYFWPWSYQSGNGNRHGSDGLDSNGDRHRAVPLAAIGSAFQETDIYGMRTCQALVCSAQPMARIVAEAFYIASTGRPGPVLIDVPRMWSEEFDYVAVEPDAVKPGYRPTVKGNPKQGRVAGVLCFISGGGAISAGAHAEIKQLAELFSIPALPR